MELNPNEPRLADVRAPWDDPGISKWRIFLPWHLWKTLLYNGRYRWYWAPAFMDVWRYRRFLKDLDLVCLGTLRSHGALTARELAELLNREKLLRTKPDLTGIHEVTVATVHDWLDLANRRGLTAVWSRPINRGAPSGTFWQLTETGQEAMRSRFLILLDRFLPLLPALIAGGVLFGAAEWLAVHPGILAWSLILGLEIVALAFLSVRSDKEETPGAAVVAIETVRSAGKPIPSI